MTKTPKKNKKNDEIIFGLMLKIGNLISTKLKGTAELRSTPDHIMFVDIAAAAATHNRQI